MAEASQQEIHVEIRPVPLSAGWERLWRWLLAPKPEKGPPKKVKD